MNHETAEFLLQLRRGILQHLEDVTNIGGLLERRSLGSNRELAEALLKSGDYLKKSLFSVFTLAQLELDPGCLTPEPVDVREECRLATERVRSVLDELGLELHLHLPEPVTGALDAAAVRRILSILVSNAIRHTREGSITVSVGTSDGFAVISVADTGTGIGEAFLPYVFEAFTTEQRMDSQTVRTSGLSLAVAKCLAEVMGGTIEAVSARGQGSTFTVRLPLAATPERAQPATLGGHGVYAPVSPSSARSSASQRVYEGAPDQPWLLFAEDNPVTQRLVALMLKDLYNIGIAATVDEAIEMGRDKAFDVLLLDISLNERRTGIEVLHTLRLLPEYETIPAIACTAYGLGDARAGFLGAGFDGFLAKPFSKKQLVDAIEEARHAERQPYQPAGTGGKPHIQLPDLPGTLPRVTHLLSKKDAQDSIYQLIEILETDPAISARVLGQVNSAYFSLRGTVATVERAVTLLGFEPVCNLVVTEALRRTFSGFTSPAAQAVFDQILRSTIATAAYARSLAQWLNVPEPGIAFTAGILHQVGRLGLLSSDPDQYAGLWHADDEAVPHLVAPELGQELIHFGTDYVAVGQEIATAWDLPPELVTAVSFHRRPEKAIPPALTLLVAASMAATEQLFPSRSKADGHILDLDSGFPTYLKLARQFGETPDAIMAYVNEQADDVRTFVSTVLPH